MVSPRFVKGALLLALVMLLSVNAMPAEESTVHPAQDDTPIPTDLPTTTQSPPDNKNTTTTDDPKTTTATTSTTPETTTPTTPKTTTSTTTSSTTTSTTPASTTSSSTTTSTTPTPAPSPAPTTSTETPTTPAPTPVPHCKRFDAYSFVGGMILAYGSLAISLVLYKFYKTHWTATRGDNGSYRTL
ncbi:adipocyte plasma membrane-associated protein Hemomucin-like [Anopheles nili]|uniref:adipocyte plasma membrane-associated protein Hemomucin-like n=1 Tax=Anopheles nili TaxID=185578 RepID=UPI00237A4A77|nr:adipocyte plasma membrane-associated protein Hemomucin-like [Anopheles nili]XP_053671185.1 adipocyte plasma membrane-associated protein Hemomucin-like [Anopheles nili]